MRTVKWRRVVTGGLVLGAVAGLATPLVHDLHARPIRSVRIAGEFRHVSRAALEAVISEHLQRGFFRVDVDAVRGAAMGIAWIRDASVRRVWPGSLHVAVVERSAVARWNDSDLMEADGHVFHPRDPMPAQTLPRLAGPSGTERRVLARYESIKAAFATVPVSVRGLELDRRGAWRAVVEGDVILVLGPRPNSDSVQRLAGAWTAVFGSRHRDVQRIDLRYANGFAVRWRSGTPDGDESPAS